MDPKIMIRNESDADASAIGEVTAAAFKTLQISNHTEQFIIEALRAAKALTVSLVAEMNGAVIGHIAFSPVTISDGTGDWYGLGPVSVLPTHQRQGIGKALIEEGLSRLKAMNARGCCLVGHPDYYRKFGFRNSSSLVVEGVPPEVFFALSFDGRSPQGSVAFHDGFRADGHAAGGPVGSEAMETHPVLDSALTCPYCGFVSVEVMPTDACVYFHQCLGCRAMLRPKAGDCCVFCSYGSVKCPPVQEAHGCCCRREAE